MFAFDDPAFQSEEAAYDFVERRVWPEGPICPHCGTTGRSGKLRGGSTKVGTYKCYSCRKPFNVKIGTMLESTHVPLHMWLQAIFLLHTCRPGVSVHRLHQILGVSSRTTWLMAQRLRTALDAPRDNRRVAQPRAGAGDNRRGDGGRKDAPPVPDQREEQPAARPPRETTAKIVAGQEAR